MGIIVIVGCKPADGKETELQDLMKTHHPMLLSQELVMPREPSIAEGQDGTVIEVFEWLSAESIQ